MKILILLVCSNQLMWNLHFVYLPKIHAVGFMFMLFLIFVISLFKLSTVFRPMLPSTFQGYIEQPEVFCRFQEVQTIDIGLK